MARRAHAYLPKRPRHRQAVRWHTDEADKASIAGVVCRCIQNDKDGYIFQSVTDETVHFTFSHDEYEAQLNRQDFDFVPAGLSLEKARAKLKAGVSSINELAAQAQHVVNLRQIAIWKFNEMKKLGLTSSTRSEMKKAIPDIQAYVDAEARRLGKDGNYTSITIPGARQFERWILNLRKNGQLGLASRRHRCGNRKQRYNGEEYALAMKHAYRFLTPERPTAAILYRDLKAEISGLNNDRRKKRMKDLRLPDEDYFYARINELAPFDVEAGRHSVEEAKRSFHPSNGGIPGLFRPFQRVEVDDWEAHLHTLLIDAQFWEAISPELQAEAKRTRCNLSVAICCVTRVIPALVLGLGPDSTSTLTLLRMCMADKTALAHSLGCETPWEYRGNIFQFAADEGSAILNARTQGVCDFLDIEYQSPQIETPQQRARVERVIQTIDIRSLLRFSGRAFSNPQVRGKYEAAVRACLTVNELAALLVRFIVDEYHNTPHAGLDGETPRHCWLRLTKQFAPRSLPGKATLRLAFGQPYTITLQPGGIEIFGNWYTSTKVAQLYRDFPQREYLVMVDGEDLGGISLQVEAGMVGPKAGWLSVIGPECMNGVSATVWDMALKAMRRETKHIEEITAEIRNRAIAFARMPSENPASGPSGARLSESGTDRNQSIP
ncbi:integrase [Bradyrhizobium japonicum]|uniref:integrase n=1 Tax=Bradyrhizobium japonicum TaxID=375 RepID=UPI002714D487|nr:integrase [Bradyrhizobium japonicum]WLB25261.1 integrase [Bradyrhizobium japonicum]